MITELTSMGRTFHGAGKAPLLVLIAGAPAFGKSTLARELATTLSLPIISRDRLYELLADTLRVRTLDEATPLGAPAVAMHLHVVAELLQAGVSLVAEANYPRALAEPELRPLAAMARSVLLHCQADRDTSVRRYLARQRHWSWFDGETIARAGSALIDWDRYVPMELGIPTLLIDTTNGYAPDLDAIIEFVRRAGRED